MQTLKTLTALSALGLFVALSLYSLGRVGYFDTVECADCKPEELSALIERLTEEEDYVTQLEAAMNKGRL